MKQTLTAKLIKTISGVYFVALLLFGWFMSDYQTDRLLKDAHSQSQIYIKSIVLTLKKHLSNLDIAAVENTLNEFIQLEGINKITVVNLKNKIQAEYIKTPDNNIINTYNYGDINEAETKYSAYHALIKVDIVQATEELGAVIVDISYAHIKELKYSIWLTVLMVGLMIFAIALSVLAYKLKEILSPLEKLCDFTNKFTINMGKIIDQTSDTKEIHNLLKSVNWASLKLKEQDDELRHAAGFLEKQIAERTKELVQAKEYADAASQEKTHFLSRMSHELRTPLNSILGFSQILLLKPEQLSEIQVNNITEINKSGHHLLSLVNEVLDVTRIEEGLLSLAISPINVTSFIDNFYNSVSALASKANIDLTIENTTDESLCVLADQTRLTQVMYNLVSNAIKYNKENGSIKITLNVDVDNTLKVAVSDTGIGISEENKNKVFNRFTRFDSEQYSDGIGIGLHLTKELVELMHGKINYTSEYDAGSVFWFNLPLDIQAE